MIEEFSGFVAGCIIAALVVYGAAWLSYAEIRWFIVPALRAAGVHL